MTFRYDIGLLRAIAVWAVLLYHFEISGFASGFMGVDIFFVISGFLMTKIILSGFNNANFSYLEFLERRVHRIVPALLVLALFLLLFLPFFYFNSDLKLNAKYIGLGLTFLSNIYYAFRSNAYFSVDAVDNIFLHSWTLAVEMQFYLLYPLLLLALRKIYETNISGFRAALVGVTLISYIICAYCLEKNAAYAFYLMPARSWEFLLGGIAFLYTKEIKQYSRLTSDWIFYIALLIVVVSVVAGVGQYPWPSSFALVPTLATMVLLGLNKEYFWLRNRVIQYFGNISYSLYLWHWPIYVLFKKYEFLFPYRFSWFIPLLLSVALASLSYYWIEQKKGRGKFRFVALAMPAVAGLILVLYAGAHWQLWDRLRLLDKRYMNYFQYDEHAHLNPCNCYITDSKNYAFFDQSKCLAIDTAKQNILLMGDSHAAQLSAAFRKVLTKNQKLQEISLSLTFPFPNPRGYHKAVDLWRYFYREYLPQNHQHIDKVFVSVHWLMFSNAGMHYTKEEIEEGIHEMITYFERYGLDYRFIGQTEEYTLPYHKIALRKKTNKALDENRYVNAVGFRVNNFLRKIIPQEHYIDIYQLPALEHDRENVGAPYMFDRHHLSPDGASRLVKYLKQMEYF